MDIKDIQNLIKFISKSGVCEVKLEVSDIKITVRNADYFKSVNSNTNISAAMPMQQIPISPPVLEQQNAPTEESQNQESTPTKEEENNYITIKSPMIGTFYRKQSPDKPNLIEIGATIKEGDKLCVIEAMKLFNHIESEVSGKVVKVLVDDASPVEFDQSLFLVDPS